MRARAPGKLILSGEHAVVYGNPALAMAIDRYAESAILDYQNPKTIAFNLMNISYAKEVTLATLSELKKRILYDYELFLTGSCSIKEVLKMPFELLQVAVTTVLEKLKLPLAHGVAIKANSDIPIGCGMGSSAAIVISTLYALAHFFNLQWDKDKFLTVAKEVENLQHGNSSGLDLTLALHGGLLLFEQGKIIKQQFTENTIFYAINTGKPISSTGQCVEFVRPRFNQSLLEQFKAITINMQQALACANNMALKENINYNHQLLYNLGVVPDKVQQLVQTLQQQGIGAKICGAGAICGDKGGVVVALGEEAIIASIVKRYGYSYSPVALDVAGVHVF